MSIVRKNRHKIGSGKIDRFRPEPTEAEIDAWKAADGYDDVSFDNARFVPSVNVRAIRQNIGLTQREFAHRYRLSLRSVQEWEQGRKQPSEAARVLLFAISREPKALAKALG